MFLLPAQDLLKPFLIPGLKPLLRRMIIVFSGQGIGKALHGCDLFLRIMGVDVPFAVIQVLHQLCLRIADLQRHRFCQMGQSIRFCFVIGKFHGIGLGCHGHIDDRMRQIDGTFGHTDEMTGLIGRNGNLQRP